MASADSGIKGINLNGISKMKAAISNYKTAIKNTPNLGVSTSKIAQNMKGSQAQSQVQNLSTSFISKTNSLLLTLDKLNQSLDAVAAGYKKQDQTAASNINSAAGKLKS